jgi:mannitol-1-/sugar-/sorbitol-6-phosphatase
MKNSLARGRPLPSRAMAFDLDGTLIDSWGVIRRVWTRWAIENEQDPERLLALSRGCRTRDVMELLMGSGSRSRHAVTQLEKLEQDASKQMTPMRGARELLASIPRSQWAIVTSSSRPSALAKLAACDLPVPDLLITGDEVAAGKPDPEGYLAAASRLSIQPSEMIVFEDSESGVVASTAAGAVTVGIGPLVAGCALTTRHIDDFSEISACSSKGMLSVHFRS